jgi:GntR family transcriptional regulator
MLEAHGYTPTNRIIEVSRQPAAATLAAELDIAPEAEILQVKKLFLADGEPVIFTVNHIPTALITTPYTADDFHPPISQFLKSRCQQELTYCLSEIVPLVAPDCLVEILHLTPTKTALLAFDEVGYNQDNAPILKARSYFRDDLLRLRLIRREMQ